MDHIRGAAGAQSRSPRMEEEEEEDICNVRNIPPSPSFLHSAMIFIDSGALLREESMEDGKMPSPCFQSFANF